MISISKFPNLKNSKIIIDVNNVVYPNNLKTGQPTLKFFFELKDKLMNDYGISSKQITSICDAPLRYFIEEKDELLNLIKTGEILQAPSGKKADDFIILYAQELENCHIITNDCFQDYLDEIDEVWLRNHRIAFMFIEDRILLSPCRDSNPKNKKKKRSKKQTTKPKAIISTDDILGKISASEGQFNLYS